MNKKIILFLFIAVCLFYAKCLSYEFVLWDDDMFLLTNVDFDPLTFDSIIKFWKRPQINPLVFSFWGLEHTVLKTLGHASGFSSMLFHLNNILFHGINTVLVFLLITNIFGKKRLAVISSLIFAFHPIQVEAVAWVSGLRDVMGATFYLLCIYSFIQYLSKDQDKARPKIYALSLLFFALAFFSKATTIVLAGIIPIVFLYYRRDLRQGLRNIAPFILLSVLMLLMMRAGYDIIHRGEAMSYPPASRLVLMGDSALHYIKKLIFPFSYAIDYGRRPDFVLSQPGIANAAIIPLLSFLLFIPKKLSKKKLGLAFALIILPLLPVSGLIPFVFQRVSTVADRYAYLSMLGVVVLISHLLERIDYRKRKIAIPMSIIAATMLFIAFIQTSVWKNTPALMQNAIKVNRNSFTAFNNLGTYWFNKGAYTTAERYFNWALEAKPDYVEAVFNVGMIHYQRAEYPAASDSFEQTLDLAPDFFLAYKYLGEIAKIEGREKDAAVYYELALQDSENLNLKTSFTRMDRDSQNFSQ